MTELLLYLTHQFTPIVPDWLTLTVVAVIEALLLLSAMLGAAGVFVWFERKVAGRIQDRLGPTRVGGRFGWLQPPADGIKLLCKEDLIPEGADRVLFKIAPYISFCATFCAYLALPFASGWAGWQFDTAAFFILAIAGLEVFGVVLGGYSSNSKYSLLGAMREAAQMVSYEIPLALCVVIPVLIVGSMDLVAIGDHQAGWFWNWHIFHDPFTFCTFFIFMTCATASTNRAPFDLPEAESELVAGFMTEYSGYRWVIFFMAEYAAMFMIGGLGTVLFLGGWNGPIPVGDWVASAVRGTLIHVVPVGQVYVLDQAAFWIANLFGLCNFIVKVMVFVVTMIWARWSLPRLRIDQVVTTCLKYCVPLASVMLAGAIVWCYLFPSGVVRCVLHHLRPAAVEQQAEKEDDHCKLKIVNCKLQIDEQQTQDAKDDQNKNDKSADARPNGRSASPNLQFSIFNFQFAMNSEEKERQ
jgi:NADH-quinone oxidoreductase subunit H